MKRIIALTVMLVLPAAPVQAEDSRMPVELNGEQKAFVLGHMRDMLETLTDTQQLLLEGDRDAIRERITQLQSHEQAARPRGMGQQIPPAFRAMAQSMRPHWQAIQDDSLPVEAVQQHVVDLMRVCNACHRTFAIR